MSIPRFQDDDRRDKMDNRRKNSLWNKVFDIDSQAGTGRFVIIIAIFVVIGGGLAWLIG